MGKRPRLVIGGTKQDLIANKENISEFTMVKDSMKKKSLKNNVTAKREKISTKYNNNEAKVFSQIKQNKQLHCTYQKSQIPQNAIVVLERCDEKAISVAPDVTLKDSYKAKNSHYKLKNILSRCECHSNLLLKDAVVVLERLDENSVTLFKVDGKAKEVPNKTKKGTKRKIEEKSEDTNASKSKKARKQKDSNDTKSTKKEKIPDVSALDFSNDSKSPNGERWNFKISSWNINGIRAWLEKDGISYLHHEQPDILCIQETKCSDDKLPDEMKNIEGYHTYWLAGDKEGYSGVGLLTKEKPIKVDYGIGISEHDNEGRVITAEYEKFYLVSTYVPNAGRGLVRLDYRMKWDKDFREYLKKLDAKKPIILTGDLNVAHEEIDLANPKSNKRNAGFTKEEREGFSALLKEGFIDSFRHLYPNVKGAYTFWTYMMNARAKNVGWRLDYFVISERFTENLCDSVIRKDVFGSDHCPITLFLSL